MKISDVIADMILDMFDDNKSTVQIQRNDLAARVMRIHPPPPRLDSMR